MTGNTASAPAFRVRWRIFSLLVSFAMVVYFQQRSVTIAAERIMPELSLSQMQIGWLQWAFLLSYTCMQFPGGVLGQRMGGRRALTAMMLVAVIATAALPLAPDVLSGTAVFLALLGSQFVLGLAHGPFSPVCAGVMEAWLPASRWGLAQGLHTMGLQVGAALAPPVLVILMQAFGWQSALFWASLPPLALIFLWARYGRNTPQEHPGVVPAELAELEPAAQQTPDFNIGAARIRAILLNPDILRMTLSYIFMNYVFYLIANWCFLYLVQERGFVALEGGWLASLPPIAAAVGAGSGGFLVDRLCRRFGVTQGFRLLPAIALPASGLLLLAAAYGHNAYIAVAALTLSFGVLELTESCYWAGTMRVARGDTMAATGVMNTGGNLGGLIGIPIVAYLSGHQAWETAFLLGLGFALVATLLWLGVDVARPLPETDAVVHA